MTERRLAWALRTRGPALPAWPAAERDAALLLLRHSPAARHLLADALAADEAPEPDAASQTRMLRRLRRSLGPPPAVVRGMRLGALAACVAAGLYLGASGTEADLDPAMDMQIGDMQTVSVAALDL